MLRLSHSIFHRRGSFNHPFDTTRSKFDGLETSSLRKLPNELIINIVDLLPVESAVAFSISCRHILSIIGTQYLVDLNPGFLLYADPSSFPTNRCRFLNLLERDLQGHVFCDDCKKLHSIDHVLKYMRFNGGLPCRKQYLDDQLPCWKERGRFGLFERSREEELSLTALQIIVKLYYRCRSYSNLLKIFPGYTTPRSYSKYYKSAHDHFPTVEQSKVSARIVAGSILLRRQWVFVYQPPESYPILGTPRFYNVNFTICLHFSYSTVNRFCGFNDRLHVEYWADHNDHRNWTGMIQCKHCHTDFRIDFKSMGKQCSAMFVTKWVDLGDCRSVQDEKWSTYTELTVRGRLEPGPPLGPPWIISQVKFPKGSVCAGFEGNDYSDFQFDAVYSTVERRRLLWAARLFFLRHGVAPESMLSREGQYPIPSGLTPDHQCF